MERGVERGVCAMPLGEGGAEGTADGEGGTEEGGGAKETRVLESTLTHPPGGLVFTTCTRPTWRRGWMRARLRLMSVCP